MGGNKTFCVIDVETPNRNNDRISSIAVVLLKDGEIVKSVSYFVNPEVPFDAFNTRLTGIDEAAVQDCPTFPVIWEKIKELFADSILVAHNAPFDVGVLRRCLAAYDIPAPEIHYIDTVRIARARLPELPNHKLNTICSYLGIPLDHHQADSDAMACAMLLQYLLALDPDAVAHRQANCGDSHAHRPRSNSRRRVQTDTAIALRDLDGIIRDITADDRVTKSEAISLALWMDNNQALAGNYPFDLIFDALSNTLADGVINQNELDELLEILKSTLDPVQACCAQAGDAISVRGKYLCLTGEFDRASRSELFANLSQCGAMLQSGVNKKTDYLVVGGQGSSAWSAGTYGNKVKRALELQAQGCKVQIIREADFFQLLDKGDVLA